MRNLYSKYKQFFCVPANGKVSEKTMMRRIALSIAVAVVCMGAMSISAYAFVTWNVTSGVNVIKSAHFEGYVEAASTAVADENDVYTLTEGAHSFTLGNGGDATTGYYKILIDDDRDALRGDVHENDSAKWTYYSKQIIKTEKEQRTVTIIVPEGATAYVKFVAEWGTYSGKDATDTINLEGETFDNIVKDIAEDETSEQTFNDADQAGDSNDKQQSVQTPTEPAKPAQPDKPADDADKEPATDPTDAATPSTPADDESQSIDEIDVTE